MPELQRVQKRQVAVKVSIKGITDGKYVKEEGWVPNYVEINGKKVSRANIIGTIVFKSAEVNFNYNNMVVDDGSGKIAVRSFEKNDYLSEFDVGDAVLIIGRLREFNNEKYIIPEIVRKIQDPMWIKVRKLELEDFNMDIEIEKTENGLSENVAMQIANDEAEDDPGMSDSDSVCKLIKKLDLGDGVPIEDLIKNSNVDRAERLINGLLENGDIFEIRPGMVKVLE